MHFFFFIETVLPYFKNQLLDLCYSDGNFIVQRKNTQFGSRFSCRILNPSTGIHVTHADAEPPLRAVHVTFAHRRFPWNKHLYTLDTRTWKTTG